MTILDRLHRNIMWSIREVFHPSVFGSTWKYCFHIVKVLMKQKFESPLAVEIKDSNLLERYSITVSQSKIDKTRASVLPNSEVRQFLRREKNGQWFMRRVRQRSLFGRGTVTEAKRGRMSLACRTSFPVSPGKSIQRPRHDVQHPHTASERSTVITILHVTLSAHPTDQKRRRRHGGVERRRRTRRTRRTLTTLQYTGGHGVYKPPQFYLRPF